jgi:hypothetical protein
MWGNHQPRNLCERLKEENTYFSYQNPPQVEIELEPQRKKWCQECKLVQTTMENSMEAPQKTKNRSAI